MPIMSSRFSLFTVLTLAIYYLLPRRFQNVWLLLVSYVFIGTWSWKFVLVLGLVTIFNFLLAQKLNVIAEKRQGLLWAGIGFNVFILMLFRVANFFLPELEAWLVQLGISTQAGGLQILVPLGLSYYVLQVISYLVDVYRGQFKAEIDFLDFALYLAYFPKMIAGPIERARSFLPKLAAPRLVDKRVIANSTLLIFIGMVRKLLIADILAATILSDVFEIPAKYTAPELMIWLLIYAFSLYNDFAGYTDIVRGISGLFGIELSPNFRTPYFSRSFSEFWQRWHISLSEWLRDYIYFPLSRVLSRRNPSQHDLAKLVLPPMVTMLVSGLWHGFGLHMLLWGGLHGLYQIVERILRERSSVVSPQNQPIWRQGFSMVIVFTFVILAWVPFRWELPIAFDFWRALLNWSSVAIRYRRLFFVLPFLVSSLVIDLLQYRSQDEFVFLKWPRLAQAVCMAFILLLIFMTTGGDFEQPFVYQAF